MAGSAKDSTPALKMHFSYSREDSELLLKTNDAATTIGGSMSGVMFNQGANWFDAWLVNLREADGVFILFTEGDAKVLNNQGIGYKEKLARTFSEQGKHAALYREANAILAEKARRPTFKIYIVDGIKYLPEQAAFNLAKGAPSFGPETQWKEFIERGCVFTPASSAQHQQEKIVAQRVDRVDMTQAGSDAGSSARTDLRYFAYLSGDWLMLGHSLDGGTMTVVKPGPWVKKATGWRRVWNDAGSGNEQDYDIYVPTCGDSEFLALGCVCVFGNKDHSEPLANSPFACVHKSMCEPVPLGRAVWSDAGCGAKHDITLNEVPGIGTMWPSTSTLSHPGQAHKIKTSCL